MQTVMEEEVRHLAGERHEQHERRRAHRLGKKKNYWVVDGQQAPIRRTRLRTADRREQRLGSYERFQRNGPPQRGVWDKKVKALTERPLGQLRLCAIVIDGTPFKDRQMIVALGIGCDGRKTVLGLREGATENTALVSSLLSELVERGVDFSAPGLYILDGGKALAAVALAPVVELTGGHRQPTNKKRGA